MYDEPAQELKDYAINVQFEDCTINDESLLDRYLNETPQNVIEVFNVIAEVIENIGGGQTIKLNSTNRQERFIFSQDTNGNIFLDHTLLEQNTGNAKWIILNVDSKGIRQLREEISKEVDLGKYTCESVAMDTGSSLKAVATPVESIPNTAHTDIPKDAAEVIPGDPEKLQVAETGGLEETRETAKKAVIKLRKYLEIPKNKQRLSHAIAAIFRRDPRIGDEYYPDVSIKAGKKGGEIYIKRVDENSWEISQQGAQLARVIELNQVSRLLNEESLTPNDWQLLLMLINEAEQSLLPDNTDVVFSGLDFLRTEALNLEAATPVKIEQESTYQHKNDLSDLQAIFRETQTNPNEDNTENIDEIEKEFKQLLSKNNLEVDTDDYDLSLLRTIENSRGDIEAVEIQGGASFPEIKQNNWSVKNATKLDQYGVVQSKYGDLELSNTKHNIVIKDIDKLQFYEDGIGHIEANLISVQGNVYYGLDYISVEENKLMLSADDSQTLVNLLENISPQVDASIISGVFVDINTGKPTGEFYLFDKKRKGEDLYIGEHFDQPQKERERVLRDKRQAENKEAQRAIQPLVVSVKPQNTPYVSNMERTKNTINEQKKSDQEKYDFEQQNPDRLFEFPGISFVPNLTAEERKTLPDILGKDDLLKDLTNIENIHLQDGHVKTIKLRDPSLIDYNKCSMNGVEFISYEERSTKCFYGENLSIKELETGIMFPQVKVIRTSPEENITWINFDIQALGNLQYYNHNIQNIGGCVIAQQTFSLQPHVDRQMGNGLTLKHPNNSNKDQVLQSINFDAQGVLTKGADSYQ